jgi:hypothetical protein
MFPSNLMVPQVGQRGSKLSPRLWSRLIEEGLTADGSAPGDLLIEDFTSVFPQTANDTQVGPFLFHRETGGTVTAPAGVKSAARITAGSSADGAGTLISNGNTGSVGVISDTAGADKLTIFEARFALGSVTDSNGSLFIGLCAPASGATAKPLASSNPQALADQQAIGFVVQENDNDSLKFQYMAGSGSVQTVVTYGTALAAGQYYNVGFVYDPAAPASEKIKIYIDNVEQASKVSASDIAASTFPDGDNLAICASLKATATEAPTVDIDLLAFYQAG